jgi:hypothetical protein
MTILKVYKQCIQIWILLAFSICIFSFKADKKVRVSVDVICSDANIQNQIKSSILNELAKIPYVLVADKDILFIITATTHLYTQQDKSVLISLSIVLSKRIDKTDKTTGLEIAQNYVMTLKKDDIEAKCKEAVASFHVQYFEKEK